MNLKTFKMDEGSDAELRCFSAVQEVAFPSVRRHRERNMRLLLTAKTKDKMRDLILRSLPQRHLSTLRIHVAGDFFNQAYFDAWMEVAQVHKRVRFYAYTKSIPFWRNYLNRHKVLPENVKLTASLGGKFDDLILPGMCTAEIVMHPDEAKAKKLQIDHNDNLAEKARKPFALLIHAQQKAGTPAAAAVKRLRDEGIKFSYSSKPTATAVNFG